jgi:hypothetical protein
VCLAVGLFGALAGCSGKHDSDDDDGGGEAGATSGKGGGGGTKGGSSGSGGDGATGGSTCTPGEASCDGDDISLCNTEGNRVAIACTPGVCTELADGPRCVQSSGGGSSGGSGGSTGGDSATGGSGDMGGSDETGGSGGSTGGSTTGGSGGSGDAGGSGGSGAGGGGSGGLGGGAGAGSECPTDGFFLCDCVPGFGDREQVVDGAGDEFDGIPPMVFEVSGMPYINPDRSTPAMATVAVRAAWSEDAFVAHVHVVDPLVMADTGYTLWNGDSVQLFVAGTSALTGAYSGTEDAGAIHVIVAPPDGVSAARAISIYEPCYACVTTAALATSAYAARMVDDGYEVEVRLPWAADAVPRMSGSRIGLDLVIGVGNDAGLGLELEGALRNDPVLASESCSPTPTTHPGCDDRVWCTPWLK